MTIECQHFLENNQERRNGPYGRGGMTGIERGAITALASPMYTRSQCPSISLDGDHYEQSR